MLPKDAPSECPNEGGSGPNVSTGAATSNSGSPGEAPRMALESMINNMAVLGPKSEKHTHKPKKKEPSESDDSSESEASSKDDEAGNGKDEPRKGKGAATKKKRKGKKPRAPKQLTPEVSCCTLPIVEIKFQLDFLSDRKRPSETCSTNCRS